MIYIVYSPKNFGGVRNFSRSLHHGLENIKENCILIEGLINLLIYTIFKKKGNYVLIASLNAGLMLPFYKNNIFILHGFPNYFNYGFIEILI